jgi:hypothetical protein
MVAIGHHLYADATGAEGAWQAWLDRLAGDGEDVEDASR